MSSRRPRPLALLLTIQLLIVMVPLLLISAWGVYFGMRLSFRDQSLDIVRKYHADRVGMEEKLLHLIEQNHKILGTSLLESLNGWNKVDPTNDFKKQYEQLPDGSWRSREQGFDGTRMAGAWIHTKDPDLKTMRQMLAQVEVASNLGRAFLPLFINTFFVGPQKSMTVFWPTFPSWIHSLGDHFNLTVEPYFQLTKSNPDKGTRVTPVYLDRVSGFWLISAVTPIFDEAGNYISSVGHDLRLNEILSRVETDAYPGTLSMILDKSGQVIVHPVISQNLQVPGTPLLQNVDNEQLDEISELVRNNPGEQTKTQLKDQSFVIITPMGFENWVYVTHVSESALENTPIWMRNFSLIHGFIILLLILSGVFWVISRRILDPVDKLMGITRRIKEGDYKWIPPRFKDREMTLLVESLKTMTDSIQDRDRRLLTYSTHLEFLVEERTEQISREQARTVQATKMATLGEMAGGIAHEINNPLASIELSAVSLQKRLSADKDVAAQNTISSILKMTARMAKIVKGLKQYSRDASGDPKELVSIRSIIEDSLALCQMKLALHGVALKVIYMQDNEPLLPCRASEISQVLVNLVGNSVDAIEQAKIPADFRWVNIEVNLEQADTMVIAVTDSGPGIPAHDVEKIMNPFFTTKPVGKGTGLGLSISKNLIETHGGSLRLNLESERTRFEIRLPLS